MLNSDDLWHVRHEIHEHEHKYHLLPNAVAAPTPEHLRWQRLSWSVPPEGRDVLLWGRYGEDHYCIVGRREGDEYTRTMATGMYAWEPTHWMHIPFNDRADLTPRGER